MSTRAALCVLGLAVLGLPFLSRSSAAGPWSLDRGEYYSELSGSLFSTTSVYDVNGDRQAAGVRLEERAFTSWNEFGWRKRANLILALTGKSVSAVAGFGPYQITQAALTDVTLGMRWRLMNGARGLAAEVDWTAPLGYDRETSFGLLGDGRQRLGGSLACGTAIGHGGFVQASGGYLYRFERFGQDSFAAPNYYATKSSGSFFTTSADAGWWVGKSLLVGGRYAGQTVTASSGGGDTKNLEPDAKRQLVGPFVLLRVDDRIDVKAGSWSTAAGRNTFHFDQYYVAFAFKQSKLSRLQGFLGSARP
jgi:hypothetical protein